MELHHPVWGQFDALWEVLLAPALEHDEEPLSGVVVPDPDPPPTPFHDAALESGPGDSGMGWFCH